ncbi:MAG: alpha-E domain-containing protein [Paracoccaceae bacterium]|nr:alpha-E domain-containing protein [Paracoccaceae bacterium]
MLGKTAGGLFWMFRYLERSENTARLVEAGFRMALTRGGDPADEWASVIDTAGARAAYLARYDAFEGGSVVDLLLRDREYSSSVLSSIETARSNARLVRTALTREVWEATNEAWMTIKAILQRPVREQDMTHVLGLIRQQSALVRGALHGSMLRNDGYDFARIGTFLERADNTARILDVKYYVLLPSLAQIGSSLDNMQWESVLRSVAGQRAYRWITGGEIAPMGVAEFVILDGRMPRSLAFSVMKLADNLSFLENEYGARHASQERAEALRAKLRDNSIDTIFEQGLHEFLVDFLADIAALGAQIEQDYRFTG